MQLASHHRWALVGAVATSAIALTDAVTHGVTGGRSPFSEESDLQALVAVGNLVHGLAYAALAVVLVREADRFRSTNVVARAARWVVLVSLAVLTAGFVLVAPVIALRDAYDSPVYTALGAVVAPAFIGMILGSLVLGLAVLRNRSLGIGGRVLALMLPVLAGTMLLAWLAPAWAHPAYLETMLQLGLALVGVDAVAAQPGSGAATPLPTTAA